jgi:biofilm PGA synthesis N-glycosyltransferase PgaC
MWLATSAVFYSSLAVVAWTYAGYPMLVYGLARLRPRIPRTAEIEPTLSVVLAVRDERAHLAAKLENLLALDYPAGRREIIVVSDGSTDGTEELVASFADRGVILERTGRRVGKPAALNRGVARATGELVVFCDARQQIDARALRALARPFADPEVGAVSGELRLPSTKGPGMYWRYEAFIRAQESKVDSLVGATGALYAIRRRLFRPLPEDTLVDDMFTPLQIVLRGYRVLFEPDAVMHDVEVAPASEFKRKARTLAGNFQLLRHLPQLLDPRRNRLFIQFVSHKLMRLACPFALAALLASNAVLVVTFAPGWPLYVMTLGAQLAGYGLALRGAVAGERASKVARLAHTFVVLNVAALEGLRRFIANDMSWTAARDPVPPSPSRRWRFTSEAPSRPAPSPSRWWRFWTAGPQAIQQPGRT